MSLQSLAKQFLWIVWSTASRRGTRIPWSHACLCKLLHCVSSIIQDEKYRASELQVSRFGRFQLGSLLSGREVRPAACAHASRCFENLGCSVETRVTAVRLYLILCAVRRVWLILSGTSRYPGSKKNAESSSALVSRAEGPFF